jgi:hypothetical protein
LVRAHLSDAIQYHTVIYDIKVFSVLQIKHIRIKVNEPTTPYALFYNNELILVLFRVCGFAVVAKNTVLPPQVSTLTRIQQATEVLGTFFLASYCIRITRFDLKTKDPSQRHFT